MNVKKINPVLFTILIVFALFIVLIFFIDGKYGIIKDFEETKNLLAHGMSIAEIDEDYLDDYYSPLQYKTDILHYDLGITVDTDRKIITGNVTITGTTDSVLNSIPFNFYDNFETGNILLNGAPVKYEYDNNRLIILPDEPVTGDFKVKIDYRGRPLDKGLGAFSFEEQHGSLFVYNLSEPVFASAWYPCDDMPTDKALFDIRITADSAFTGVSNGNLEEVVIHDSTKTWHWKTVYPMATYLAAIYVADYEHFTDKYVSVTGDTLDLEYYVTPAKLDAARKDFAPHPELLEFMEKMIAPYPFMNEKYGVAEFAWTRGAMENQTITGMGSKFIGGLDLFRDLYVHELAHHWWGNSVGLKDWRDIWLNEGFSTYSEALYKESLGGKEALASAMFSKKGEFEGETLYDPGFLFSRTVYDKGAWVLHMLRDVTGDSLFFDILRNYYRTYKYKNADSKDFVKIAESLSGKNLRKFFDQWLFSGKGIPEIEYEFSSDVSGGTWFNELKLEQVQDGYDTYEFPLETGFEGSDEIKKFYITSRDTVIKFETGFSPGKLIPDPNVKLLAGFEDSGKN